MSLIYEKTYKEMNIDGQLPFKPLNIYKRLNLIDSLKDSLRDTISNRKKDFVRVNTTTIVGVGTVIKGDLNAQELIIAGSVKGSVVATKLTITRNAYVEADIKCQDIVIAGKVIGDINAEKKAAILAKDVIEGDIMTNSIKVEDGAIVNGNIQAGKKGDINIGNHAFDS